MIFTHELDNIARSIREKINFYLENDDPEKLAYYIRAWAELEYLGKMSTFYPSSPQYMYPSPPMPCPPTPWGPMDPNPWGPNPGVPQTRMGDRIGVE